MTLDIQDLTVTTSTGVTLLDRVTWSVPRGGRVGIIGESGSGKSLTAAAVMGLLPSGMRATGSIMWEGRNLLTSSERQMRRVRGARIAMVFQEPLTALDPLMTVGKQIAGPLALHRNLTGHAARSRVKELLERVSLADSERIAASYPWQLSGGQRQRVALAMALACEPDVLIADEPTTALDVTVQAEILALVDELISGTTTTLIFVSHDLPVITQVANDIVVMRNGRVTERTTTQRLVSGPREHYTQQLVDAASRMTALPRKAQP